MGIHKLIIIGNNDTSVKIVSEINNKKNSGYNIVDQFSGLNINKISSAVIKFEVDEVILADSSFPQEDINKLIDLCQEKHIVFRFVPVVSQIFSSNFEFEIFHGLPLVEIKRTKLDGWGKVIKRAIDIFTSIFGLVFLSPIFGIIALTIKWETEGPIFVKLKRVSGTKEFDLYKFRSMIDNAHELNLYLRSLGNDRPDAGPLWKLKNDPRVTGVGRFIRKTRIDELPQLFNVLRGELSIVGPRPHQANEIELYERHHKKVLAIKAGATGIAQVSGSSDISFEEEVTLDSYYIDNWSLWLDIKIILKTILKMFFDRSAV